MDFRRGRWAENTQKAYSDNWAAFEEWCGPRGCCSSPAEPETIVRYLDHCAQRLSTSSISQHLATIRAVHKIERDKLPKGDARRESFNLDDTLIVDKWAEIRRAKGTRKHPKLAILTDDLKRMVYPIPPASRDRALLLCCFGGALRRSEAAALNVEDLDFGEDGVLITIRRSKTDQDGKGKPVAILRTGTDTCPVAALEDHLSASKIGDGAVFRTRTGSRVRGGEIALVVKKHAREAGLDYRNISAHSMRRGCITTMFRAGVDIKNLMSHSRHKTVDIAMGYVEEQSAKRNPALKTLGL